MSNQDSTKEMALSLELSLWRQRTLRWGKLLGVFFAGQSLVQAIGLVTGFLLIRWLSVDAYAQFSVAFGFQSTVAMLADLGFCGSVVALAGNRGHQPEVLGSYVAAALHYRRIILSILFPITIVALPLLMTKHGWGWEVQVALLTSVLCSIFAQGYLSLYTAPLLIHQKLKQSYGTQVIAATSRLSLNTVLHLFSILGAATASWAATLATVLNAFLFRRSTRQLVKKPVTPDLAARKEMLGYVAPLIPGIIFTAFQSQITLFVIATFGRDTSIAEIAALGRLGQVLIILGTLNGVILSPYFAKLPRALLGRRYAQTLAVAILLAAAIVVMGFVWPGALLWVLGAKYAQLREQVSWSIVAWAISYIGGVMWTIHSARKWIFWWGTWVYIAVILIAQIAAVKFLDLSTTMNVVFFSVFTAVAVLLVHLTTAIYGFSHDKPAQLKNL